MSLKIWLPLNGNIHNYGVTNLPNTTIDTFTYESGKIGQCAKGKSAWHLNEEILGNSWSVAMWVRPINLGSANNILFCKNIKGSNDCQIYFSIISTSILNIGINGPSTSIQVTGLTFSTNTWYHVAATYNGTTASLYLNGTKLKSATVTRTYPTGCLNMCINSRSANETGTSTTGNATCAINDLRLYDHCLSTVEIKEIAQGLILHYQLNNNGINKNLLLHSKNFSTDDFTLINSAIPTVGVLQITPTGSNAMGKYKTNLDYSNYNNMTFTVSFDMREIESSNPNYTSSSMRLYYGYSISSRLNNTFSSSYDRYTYKTITINSSSWNHYSTTVSSFSSGLTTGQSSALTAGSKFCIQFWRQAQTVPIQVKNIKLEIGNKETFFTLAPSDLGIDTSIIQDCSGYNHNGSIIGTLITNFDSPRYNISVYSADGGSNYIETPTLNMPTDAITLNLWFKSSNNTPTDDYHMIVDSIGNSSTRWYYEMAIHQTGYFRGGLFVNGTRYADNCTSTTGCNGNWHMLTLTYDGSVIKRYFDGVMEKSTNVTISTGLQPTATLRLFKDGYSSYACKEAYLSDFRIYCTALSQDDINQLFSVGLKIDNKNNLHTCMLIEDNENIQINKRNQIFCAEIEEDTKIAFYKNNDIEVNQVIEY